MLRKLRSAIKRFAQNMCYYELEDMGEREVLRRAVFDTRGNDASLNHRSGQTVSVIGEVPSGEDEEFGKMYEIEFEDGYISCAFEDELKEVEDHLTEIIDIRSVVREKAKDSVGRAKIKSYSKWVYSA